ncbi:Target of rapamycin complex subunit lst8 [Eumeta japonica]|uniref:Target of rapamycin complex subunit lst8 n=1 Tax=Eumeta variegata TaxID=151549 RepID=A0A4C1V590_EUMVA|nr:Target of rapamycin complex subunit lst8 [Eumeta japonica]
MRHDLETIDFENKENFLRNEQMYLGVRVMNDLKNLGSSKDQSELNRFFSSCRNFLVTSAKEIKKRYHMSDPLLSKLLMLNPENAASSKFRESFPSIFSLIELLPRIVAKENMALIQAIDDQWRSIPAKFNELDLKLPVDKFWSELNVLEDYQELSQFALDTLCIPHSNAQCERVFSHEDGKWMYTGGEDSTAKIWDLRSPQLQCQRIFQVSAPVNAVCLHPDQSQIMVGDQSGIIHLWDLNTDHNDQLIPEAEASVQDIAIDPCGKLMAAVNNRGSCYVWALGREPRALPRKHIRAHRKYALRCKFSPDSSMLVTTSGDCSARVWRTTDWSLMRELRHDTQRWVWDAAFSADSRYLFTGEPPESKWSPPPIDTCNSRGVIGALLASWEEMVYLMEGDRGERSETGK